MVAIVHLLLCSLVITIEGSVFNRVNRVYVLSLLTIIMAVYIVMS